MFLLKLLGGLLKALNGDAHPFQISGGAWIGCMLGLSPFIGLHTAFLMSLILIFRVNMGSAFLFMGIGKLLGVALLPFACVPLGRSMLSEGSFVRPLVVSILDTPFLGLADLENHAVLGGLTMGFFLGALLFWPVAKGILYYRVHVREDFRNNKKLRWISRTWIFKIFKGMLTGVAS